MLRPNLQAIPEVAPPAGIELRSIDPTDETMIRRIWLVSGEVFSHHWGDSLPDTSEAGWRRFRDNPDVQPEHWCVAFEGDEIVGHILSYLAPDDDGLIIGWTEGIAVREKWRRRGIARAMLAWSLRRVRDAGASRAGLGVDLANPSQARTLYESLGFRVSAVELEYHRPLRVSGR
jgi:GNAT superfamily N-acetyltransferase